MTFATCNSWERGIAGAGGWRGGGNGEGGGGERGQGGTEIWLRGGTKRMWSLQAGDEWAKDEGGGGGRRG